MGDEPQGTPGQPESGLRRSHRVLLWLAGIGGALLIVQTVTVAVVLLWTEFPFLRDGRVDHEFSAFIEQEFRRCMTDAGVALTDVHIEVTENRRAVARWWSIDVPRSDVTVQEIDAIEDTCIDVLRTYGIDFSQQP